MNYQINVLHNIIFVPDFANNTNLTLFGPGGGKFAPPVSKKNVSCCYYLRICPECGGILLFFLRIRSKNKIGSKFFPRHALGGVRKFEVFRDFRDFSNFFRNASKFFEKHYIYRKTYFFRMTGKILAQSD